MNFNYDVVIIGGAFSGAATALMLKCKRPEARVLIIERQLRSIARWANRRPR
jgi:L-2-hydroxyglutarate oxidase LhgO